MKAYMAIYFVIVPIIIGFIILQLYNYARSSPYLVTPEKAKQLIGSGAHVLDVRTEMERETLGYYPGSYHTPMSNMDTIVTQLFPNKGTKLVVYCNTGQRARRAAEKLHELGYNNSVYIVGSHHTIM
jgi:phage shock protein E